VTETGNATVREVGEFDLISRLEQVLPDSVRKGKVLRQGIGDDAALFDLPPGQLLVVTSDAMIADIHFRLDWTDWSSLGHKLLAVNLSDLAAMGATPLGAVVTLGLTGNERVDDVLDLYRGLAELAKRWNVSIAGGDIVRSPKGMMLDLTAFGTVEPDRALRRSGAQPGDLIVVSGTLGASAAGMALLESGDRTAATARLLIESHLRPLPRITLGQILHDYGATSAMDLSDGLLGDLPKLLTASGMAAELKQDRIPVPAAVHSLFPEQWQDMALRGGEDYELLFTIPAERFGSLKQAALAVGSTVTSIGTITSGTPGTMTITTLDGLLVDLAPGAHDHFRN
jgi:thiamine-monophosphate kinase